MMSKDVLSTEDPLKPDKIDEYDHPGISVEKVQSWITQFFEKYRNAFKWALYVILIVVFHIYFIVAVVHDWEKAIPLIVAISVGWLALLYYGLLYENVFEPMALKIFVPASKIFDKQVSQKPLINWLLCILVLTICLVFIVVDTWNSWHRLLSLIGLIFYVLISILMSSNPSKILWRPVIRGIALQFIFGYILLRTTSGYVAFKWLSEQIVTFLNYSSFGSGFVYGENFVFAFTVLQTIVFFSGIVAVLYYYEILQFVLLRLSWLMELTLDTTAAESLNAIANIFLGMTEAPLLIRPFLNRMTKSELNAVFTSCFACISGALFATYVNFGISSIHLMSASIMSAPASLAVAKLLLPETEKSEMKNFKEFYLPPSEYTGVIEALSGGASSVVLLILDISANLVLYYSLLHLVNNIIIWFASLVGYVVTFDMLVGYLFYPLAFIMGSFDSRDDWAVRHNDTFIVAQLMGKKTVFNELIAYKDMSNLIKMKALTKRAEMLCTYALCGFSNIGSIGIQLGTFGALVPDKKAVFAGIMIRSLIGGTIACFMTACVAGIVAVDPPFESSLIENATTLIENVTESWFGSSENFNGTDINFV